MEEKSLLRRKETPFVPFALEVEDADGSLQTYHLKLAIDLNAQVTFELETGISMLTEMSRVWDTPSVNTTTALFWAALREYQPELSTHAALVSLRSNIAPNKLVAIHNACQEAFLRSLSKERADKIRANMEAAKAGKELPFPTIEETTTESQ